MPGAGAGKRVAEKVRAQPAQDDGAAIAVAQRTMAAATADRR